MSTVIPILHDAVKQQPGRGFDPTNRLASDLSFLIPRERILSRAIERAAYASDASLYHLLPQVVVQPASANEVRTLLSFGRERRIPVVFRAGGTSLSGQSITDGILVDVGRHWRGVSVERNGTRIRVQPGVTGQEANQALRPWRRKIGPDPASIAAARMGGILANNASGMCCGVTQNAYHTLESLTFVLASGTRINTADADADLQLQLLEPRLHAGLLRLRERILKDWPLLARIRAKYEIKNTTGYSLNAFADYERAVAIFSHLLIGSEGTLGFIEEAVLRTVPELPAKSTGLLLFPSIHAACAAIGPLRDAGAAALELMDRASLRSVESKPGMPAVIAGLSEDAAAILAEFQAESAEAARTGSAAAVNALAGHALLATPEFTQDATVQAQLWAVRKGLFPSVGAVRAKGSAVIIEDVAVPVERLADAAVDLIALFRRHGYDNVILFGHAKDGNLHFVITPRFNSAAEVERYDGFLRAVVELITAKYGGSLKAEHGTGRNMAPFVEAEWGGEALAIMREVKQLADPDGLLNPGVILNDDAAAHVRDLKALPVVEDEVDKCIECGFCEPRCPSRDLTLTPRQRIAVQRQLQRSAGDRAFVQAIKNDYEYMVMETCAADGMCATACPVEIDTGALVKHLRAEEHSGVAKAAAEFAAKNFGLAEWGVRAALWWGSVEERMLGAKIMRALTRGLDTVTRSVTGGRFWQWGAAMPGARKGPVPATKSEGADAVYLPSCVTRTMGALPGEPDAINTMQAMLAVAERAGVRLYLPEDVRGNCCGVPFSSKGFAAAHAVAAERTVRNLYRWSDAGRLPVVIDTSPCTYGLKTSRHVLSAEAQAMFDALRIVDATEFAHDTLLPRLEVKRRMRSVAVHPVCSAVKMGLAAKLKAVAAAASEEAIVPEHAECCGFAGDRGLLVPELTEAATAREGVEVMASAAEGCYSSSRTCEVGMARATGEVYRSFVHLLEWATRAE